MTDPLGDARDYVLRSESERRIDAAFKEAERYRQLWLLVERQLAEVKMGRKTKRGLGPRTRGRHKNFKSRETRLWNRLARQRTFTARSTRSMTAGLNREDES